MNVVEYLTMDETQKQTKSKKMSLAFTFQIPVPQSEKFIILLIRNQIHIDKNNIYFNDFKVCLYERTKLNHTADSKYSNKEINTSSFVNYLVKMNSEQILPFLEKEILGKKNYLNIQGSMVDIELSYAEKYNIKKSYNKTFSELIECINNTEKNTRHKAEFTLLHNVLKDYETERLFNKMNNKLNKDKVASVKVKKI